MADTQAQGGRNGRSFMFLRGQGSTGFDFFSFFLTHFYIFDFFFLTYDAFFSRRSFECFFCICFFVDLVWILVFFKVFDGFFDI